MELIQLAALPFRLITQNGIQAYACDLGDVRLIVYDVTLLTGGAIVQQDLYTLQNITYSWSLRLPAKLDIVQVPGAGGLYQIIPATNTVMMCCRLYSGSQGSIGEITGIVKDAQVASEKILYYNFIQQIVTVGGFPNKLVGAVVIDKFNSGIPASYSDKVKSVMMIGNTSSTSTDLLTYGTPQNSATASPYDSWVASSELEMFSLTVKEGDRCWRPDLNISLINTTGFNSSISDWRPLGGAIDSVNTEAVNTLISTSLVPVNSHINNTNNPHSTTATQVGLGLVPNHDFTAEVAANSAKVGITSQQAANINTANAHITTISGNPHRVTKSEVGLDSVPNIDFTTSVNLSIIHDAIVTGNPHHVTKTDIGLSSVPNTDFTQDVINANVHKNTITGNPHQVTKTDVGLADVPNHNFTAEVNAANVHLSTVTGNPHHVTKAEIGLSDVPNHDFTDEITANSIHRITTTGNPHQVTKADIGLDNVPNVDCTNAANITSGILPSSVIPPVVIVDTFPVSSQAAQLALTAHKGTIAVRTDTSRTYINTTGNNTSMSDWQEMMSPINSVLSVNGQVGTIVLSSTNISEGTNLYYTNERVSANIDVTANTANRHVHNNKVVLDATTDSFTTQLHNAIDTNTAKVGITQVQANAIVANSAKIGITQSQADAIVASTTHKNITSGNPHQVTKTEIGLSDVTNHDFTDEVNANTSARHNHANKLVLDATTVAFTTSQANAIIINSSKVGITQAQADAIIANTAKVGITTQQAADIVSANVHRSTITGNVHQVTKADVGLGNVPNHDFTTEVNTNTAAQHSHVNKIILDAIDTPFTSTQANAITANTAKVGITQTQADAIVANTAKVGITTQNLSDITAANTHRAAIAGNVHQVTKAEVGLSNVPNIDCTNAANITTGVLPSSVLPPLAIVDVFPVSSQVAQLALTVQKGDVAIRTDLSRTYINITGNNTVMSDWQELMTPVDSVLSVNAKTGTVILTTSDITEGSNLYYTEARVSANTNVAANTAARHSHANKAVLDATTASFTTAQANAIVANTAKVGITTAQANAIIANTAKVGITTQQATDITSANTHRAIVSGNPHQVTKSDVGLGLVPNTDFTATVAANTAARHSHANKTVLDATDTAFTATQANAITINTAKVGITQTQADAIVANTAKIGVTTQNLTDITAANTHRAAVTGNVHNVTKDDVGLGLVPNHDFTAEVAASTLVQHSHLNKTILDATDTAFTATQASAIVANTAKVGITQTQADAIVANTAKVGITTQQASDITSANTHRATITGNVHQVTKAEVGLGNVKNVDCTNADNITTGMLPSSVLPPMAIIDTYVVATQVAQLALTIQKGDIAVRTDLSRTYINITGNNTAMSDWQELATPVDTISSVNGKIGTVVLTTSDITEGTNFYYTEVRVSANSNVAANTAARHSHANKVILDATDTAFTAIQANAIVVNTAKVGITQTQADAIVANTAKVGITTQNLSDITAANTHRAIVAGNPHQVTKVDVGLANVPNTDFTAAVAANTAVQHSHSNKAILDATTVSFTTTISAAIDLNTAKVGITTTQANAIIANTAKVGITTQQATDITAANTHRAIVAGNPHQVTKADVGLANVPNTDFTAAVAASTAVQHNHSNKVILDATDTAFTSTQASAIIANTAKVGITTAQANAIIANTAKVGITTQNLSDITAANTHRAIVAGNPHQVTKADIGLSNVPNTDFTAAVAASTLVQHSHLNKTILDATDTAFTATQASAIVANTAKVGITTAQANAIIANTAKVGITTQQATDITAANTHRAIVAGNPHQVTKSDVGLGNVPNIDCTNAANITTGILPSSVLPPMSIIDTYVVATQAAQLALTVQKGDIAVRTDLSRTYINITGNNTTMSDWQELATPVDAISTINGKVGTVVLTTSDITEGSNLYYTEARVSANTNVTLNTAARHSHANKAVLDATTDSFTTTIHSAIDLNTAKVGITTAQANAIIANTAKVGITTGQAADITSANTHRATVTGNPHQVTKAEVGLSNVPNTDFTSDVTLNTTNRHSHANKTILDATDTAFTAVQASAIVANTAKVGITTTQANAIIANTAKVGITTGQAVDIVSANTHRAIVAGNPHQVTKADVGLANVPNTDFTSAVAASTSVQHSHANKTVLDATTDSFTTQIHTAIDVNTAKVGITQVQADAIVANTAKVGITTQQASDITSANTHRAAITGNVHQVTKTDVGLGNVKNIDCTNAANITTGVLPSSVLPPLAIVDVYPVSSQVAQLALTVQKGDIAVRTDLSRTYINITGNNTLMSDWQELMTPVDSVLSVNTKTGTVVLTTSDITEGTNLYYTDARVSANTNVAANTAARHSHANKAILDTTDTAFTAVQASAIIANTAKVGITQAQADAIVANTAKVGITVQNLADIISANTHRATITGNPHQVTKSDVGLGNVPNTDFTAAVAASTAVQHSHANKTILDLTTASFTTAHASAIVANTAKVGITQVQADAIVANTDKVGITTQQTTDITSANTHRAIIAGNPHQVTKSDVGLGNVKNIDCTNAANITTGILPSSVLPPMSIIDTYVVATQAAQLALTVQKGDIAVRTDLSRTYINITGNNTIMTDWQELATPVNAISTVNGQVGTVVLTTTNISEGSNLYYTEARVSANTNVAANTAARHSHANKAILDATDTAFTSVQASAIVANTAKVGITQTQADAIVANTAKVGITTQNLSDITAANTHRAAITGNVHQVTKADVGLSNVPNTDFTVAVAASTAVQHSHANKAILDATTASFVTAQASAIVANTAKVGITQAQADAIVANTAKVGITTQNLSDITAANTHRAAITGNVHQVTKAEVGLGNVPNTDFTSDVTLNTANRHSHANKTILDATTDSFTTAIHSAIDLNTAKVGITTAQANAIIANTAKVGITTQQATDITSANTHRAAVTGNVHNVTKADVGLSNVPNVDCTNASNITTGTLPSSVLPPLAIVDTYVVATQVAQLALTVQKGDVAVRTDLSKSYINQSGNNTAMSDWQELMTPINTILSVNGQTGTVVLSTTNITEGTNLYYTDARVTANTNVTANTAARHSHANKTALDLITGTNTGDQTTITGNAGSANKLATARTINNVAFDGTANITIPVGTGDVTMVGVQTLTNKTMESVVLTKSVTEGISVMTDSIITAANGTILTKALSANTTFTDSLSAGQSVALTITNASTYTVTWPTVIWVSADGNIAPLLSANNVFVFWKIGTTLYGTLTGSF